MLALLPWPGSLRAQHASLGFVLRGLVSPGHTAVVDMLTRTGHASNFAPDASIYSVERSSHRLPGTTPAPAAFKAKERAKAIVAVLEARGMAVSAEHRARIVETQDLEQLERWVRKAATVDAVERLFDESPSQ